MLIYDGDCGFCRQWVTRVQRWDREHRLAVVPFQDRTRVAELGISLPALAAAMHVVLPDGRVFAGADAAPEILRLMLGTRWLARAFDVPGVRPVARWLYARVAARRRCLVRGYAAD